MSDTCSNSLCRSEENTDDWCQRVLVWFDIRLEGPMFARGECDEVFDIINR